MVMRALLLVTVSAGIGAATIYSAPQAVQAPLISMQLEEPKSARTRLSDASLHQAR
jgi:hypothetical protein